MGTSLHAIERQVTFAAYGHVLTNTGVWSGDGKWIVYDTRSDAAGAKFDGDRIEAVNVETGEIRPLYKAVNGAHCGVATWHPSEMKVVFILGPEHPTADYEYGPARRRGVIISMETPGVAEALDARDLMSPFTAGALRGGTHVHVFSADGAMVSFTYDDDVLSQFTSARLDHDINQRNVGVCFRRAVTVPKTHPRNQDGDFFSVLVTRTTAFPHAGSEEITRAYEEAWVGTDGYERADGSHQKRTIAFLGDVVTAEGEKITEVFVADLPEDLTRVGEGPLQGTETRRPFPPLGVLQRRLTFTAERAFPGVQGPRHWVRSSGDGKQIAFLMKDDGGVVQLWTVSPNGGAARQVTRNRWSIASAFTWSVDGRRIAHVMDNSVCVTDVESGKTTRLTERASDEGGPRAEACVFSPDGKRVAYVARVAGGLEGFNQVFVTEMPE